MNFFLQQLRRFLRSMKVLLGIKSKRARQRDCSLDAVYQSTSPKPSRAMPAAAVVPVIRAPSRSPDEGLPAPEVSFRTRRAIYQTFYELSGDGAWVGLAPLGAALRKQDAAFSSQNYSGFQKLTELLEAVSDLVELDRSENRARLQAPTDLKQFVVSTFRQLSEDDHWVNLASIKPKMKELCPEFSNCTYGFDKFKDFLQSCEDFVEIYCDDSSAKTPVYYGRLRQSVAQTQVSQPKRKPKPPSKPIKQRLFDYAAISNFEDACRRLANLALPEPWTWGGEIDSASAYPVLSHYLTYTFMRLQHESKVVVSQSGVYSAFNTGLLDRKYEPIYALLGRDKQGKRQDWYLINFCVPGEGSAGKSLVNHFAPLPLSANYFHQPEDAFYDIQAKPPSVDWQHILQDNSERLPLAFWQRYCPADFKEVDLSNLSTEEEVLYKQRLAKALKADPQAYGAIANRCQAALQRTLLKIQLNYRTAIPHYNPRSKRLQLLLPLALLDDNKADCALIVDRQSPEKPYVGHTILPLSWAYQNARLLGRTERSWLDAAQNEQCDSRHLDSRHLDQFAIDPILENGQLSEHEANVSLMGESKSDEFASNPIAAALAEVAGIDGACLDAP